MTTEQHATTQEADRPGTVKQQLAAETLRLYAGDWARFVRFCAEHGGQALPASPELVASFLAMPGTSRAAVSRRLAAIDHQHRQRRLDPPGADRGLRATLRQVRKVAPGRKRDKPPVAEALGRMAQSCRGDLAGQRDRAVLLLLAAGLGRGEIVALQAEHLRFSERGLALNPRQLARSAAPASCPVRAMEEWLRSSGTRYGPVFRKINRWGQIEHAALRTDAIRLILARRAAGPQPPRPR